MIDGLRSLPILAFTLLIWTGCSGSPGITPTTVDGDYLVEQYVFEPSGFDTVLNVRDSLDLLTMEVFGQDEEFMIRYQFPGEGRARIEGSVSSQRNSAQFIVGQGDATRLLLPAESFTMRVREDGDLLTIDTGREGVDLRPFGIPQRSIDGNLRVRMVRQ